VEHVGRQRRDPVEDQHPVEMIDLVQHDARLEALEREPIGSRRAQRVDLDPHRRRTLAVMSGSDRQPSRPTSLPSAVTTAD